MYRAWLKPNWKQAVVEANYERFIIVEIERGCFLGSTPSTDELNDVDIVIVDHDNLEDEVYEILRELDFEYDDFESIYEEIISQIKLTGGKKNLREILETIASKD